MVEKLGNNMEKRLKKIRNEDLDKEKEEILWKFWKEKIKKKNREKEHN